MEVGRAEERTTEVITTYGPCQWCRREVRVNGYSEVLLCSGCKLEHAESERIVRQNRRRAAVDIGASVIILVIIVATLFGWLSWT